MPVPVQGTTDPCDQRVVSSACGCVGVGDQPSGTGLRSCGIPVEPPCRGQSIADCACKDVRGTAACGQPVPACEDLAGDACGCVTPSATPSGPGLPRDVCGIPTQPCAVAPAVCECVEVTNQPSGLEPAAPVEICGVPADPCQSASDVCECVESPDTPAGNGVVVPTTVCGRPVTIECDSEACECFQELSAYLPAMPQIGPPATLVSPPACFPAPAPAPCARAEDPVPSAPASYPTYNGTLERKENGFSTWTLKVPTHTTLHQDALDSPSIRSGCPFPEPVPYGPDHGYWNPAKGTGNRLVAHTEPWGDRSCHLVHYDVGDDFVYHDAGGLKARLVLHQWHGVLTDPFTASGKDLGHSQMVAYHDTVFFDYSWGYNEFKETMMNDEEILRDLCEFDLNFHQTTSWAKLTAKWKAGDPLPIEATTSQAYSEACLDTEHTLPSGVPASVEICSKGQGEVYTKVDTMWMFVSTAEELDGEGYMVIA